MSADRRHSTDEPFVLGSLRVGAESESARSGEQAFFEGGGGYSSVNLKRVRTQPDGCPILSVNNLTVSIKNEIFRDARLIRNV